MIGEVDVKTKTVHFYVQRSSNFGPSDGVIPFDAAPVNEGNAFNLDSGIFTVPVNGIYHFDFSAVEDESAITFSIVLQVNGATVGFAHTYQGTPGSRDTVSLNASLRLSAGDRVNVYNNGGGVLFDGSGHWTHFSGWLVEEDLM